MTHRNIAPKPRAVIGTPWFIRKVIYVVTAIVGLVAVALGFVQPGQVDQWLAQIPAIAAVIGGLMGAMNTGRESDEKPVGVPMPVPHEVPEPTPARVYDEFTAYPYEVHDAR